MIYRAKLKLTLWAQIPLSRQRRSIGRSGGDLDMWQILDDLRRVLSCPGYSGSMLWAQIELKAHPTGQKR